MSRASEERIADFIGDAEEVSDEADQPTANGRNTPDSSEDALALAFTKRHGKDLRYVAAWNRWLKWNGACWVVENTLLPFDYSRKICREFSTLKRKQLRGRSHQQKLQRASFRLPAQIVKSPQRQNSGTMTHGYLTRQAE